VTLAGIEDAIASALKADERIDFDDNQIIVSTADESTSKSLLASGGISIQYAGSVTFQDLVHGQRLTRDCRFIVTIGRKMLTQKRRLAEDIENVVGVITSQDIGEARLTWLSDRFVRVYNGVGWHDVVFKAVLHATN